MTEMDPAHSVMGSFNFCVRAVMLANESGETVHTKLWGRDVYARPGDNPHEIYKEWTRQ